MKIYNLSITRPVTIFMGLVCILVLGLISLRQLKLAFLPQVDFPAMWVFVSYPNQNPEILERTVTQPLEEGLSTIKGVKKVSSETNADEVVIRMDFDWGMTLDLIRLELGLKIEELKPSLPDGIRQIQIFSFNTDDIPVVQGRISAPGIDLSENYDLLEEHIQRRLERIPGVAKVELGGVLPKEVSIELRIDKIKEHNIDVTQVINRLTSDNMTLSAGKVVTNGLVYNVRTIGKVQSLEEFQNLVVHESGVRLSEIADIYYEEPPIGYRRHLDGNAALALDVFKESTANTVDVGFEVNRVIKEEIAADPVLQGISLLVWGDQAQEITNGLRSLTEAGVYGAIFAIIVLFFFLRRLNATLIVASAIPISIIGAFIFLYAFGYTLNVLTLMGLMLAVGMLVDNAVVVLESIFQNSLKGKSAVDATRDGTKDVVVALIAATSTTMIVFLSLAVSDKNELSVWLGAIGLTICFTLAMSLLVSVTIIPLFASKFLHRLPKNQRHGGGEAIMRQYERLLDWSLARPWKTGIGLVVLILSSAIPMMFMSNFKGTSTKTSRLYIGYEFHDFFFVSDVEAVADQVEAFIEPHREEWGLESVYSWITENECATILNFADENQSFERYKEIRKAVREGLPEVGGVAYLFEDDDNNSDQAIRIQLFGSDTAILKETGEKLVTMVSDIEGLFDARSGERSGKKELQVSVNRAKANAYGVSPEEISNVFGFTLGGTYLPRFRYGDRERDVTLGLRIEDRATIDDVSQIPLGNGVTLGSVANFEFKDRPSTIRRVDRKAHHSVRATYEGEKYDDMMKEVEARLNNFDFPAGVSWSWSDRILREQNEMGDMLWNILLALLLVYIVMACLFESLIQPFMILSTILFSFVGVSWFLFITQTEFQVMAMIGIMILLGVVVNNGIVMMDHINLVRRRGLPLKEAVRQGAKERIRPILMTAATTVIGLIPMAIGQSGIGDAYYFPLARCVIGGLVSSTVLTTVGLPRVILTGYAITGWIGRMVRGRKAESAIQQDPVTA